MYDRGRKSRPHQSFSRSWRKPAQRTPSQRPIVPAPPFGALIEEVRVDDLGRSATKFEDKAVISDCSVVASYSWLDTREATILVPGRPPRWTPLSKPIRLAEDNGEYFRDKNAALYPKYPLEPAIVAGLKTAPEIWREGMVDIVACGSSLGNLLRFVRGQDKTFRILVEMVEGTVFFIRRENSPTELIPEVHGFGHTFPENYTTWDSDVQGSTSNERLLRYNFGGLRFLVRFGADGYIEQPGAGTIVPNVIKHRIDCSPSSNDPIVTSVQQKGVGLLPTGEAPPASVPALLSSLENTRISSKAPATATASAGLAVQLGGSYLVDQSCIFDLKTRSVRKRCEDTLGEELPRLWVAQLSKFVLARHEGGLFTDIQVQDVRDQVGRWEEDHRRDLAKLASLVHQITARARGGKLELVHDGNGVLEVREALPDTAAALSPAVKAMWTAAAGRQEDVGKDNEEKVDVDAAAAAAAAAADDEENDADDDVFTWKDDTGGDFTNCSGSCGYCGRCGSS